MAFDAFVSYSHSADGQLAPALQKAIQRFAKPWYRARALRVFRDESTLSANPHLWSSIQAALDESEWFVLLVSPDAVESEWVNRELDHWLETKSPDRILVVLTDGTWEWDTAAHVLAGSAVPPVLRDAFNDEPRHLDLRWARAETDLDMRNARFRDAVAQLAAPVHGVSRDELESEDIMLHRRARRLARGGVTILVLLVVVTLVASGFALVQRHDALTQRNRANSNAGVAVAERLGAESISRRSVDDSQALLLSVEGYRRADTATTRSSLLGTLAATPQLVGYMPGSNDVTTSAISPDGHVVVAGTDNGSVRFWYPQRGRAVEVVAPPAALRGIPVASVAFDRGGTKLFVLHVDGRVEMLDPAARQPVGAPMKVAPGNATDISVSPDGNEIAVNDNSGTETLYDVVGRRAVGSVNQAGTAAFSSDGKMVFAVENANLLAYDARTAAPVGTALLSSAGTPSLCVTSGCFSLAGGASVVARTESAGGHNLMLIGANLPASVGVNAASVTSVQLGATVFDATARRVVEHLAPALYVSAMAMTRDASTVVLGGDDGTIQVWPSRGAAAGGATEPSMRQSGRIVSLALADDGTSLVSTSVGGATILWNLSGNGAIALGHGLPSNAGLFKSSTARSCAASESPINTTRSPTSPGGAVFANDACTASLSVNPSGSTLAVSADASSLWDLATRPARLRRVLGREFTATSTPLAFDSTGTRVLFAVGFSLPGFDDVQGKIGKYEIATVAGARPREVLKAFSIVSDANSGQNVLVVKHGKCCPESLTFHAMNPWNGRTFGSFRPLSIVDRLVRARAGEVLEVPLFDIRELLTAEPRHAIVDAQGRRAVTVSAFGDVVLWDLRSGRVLGDPIIATGRTTPAASAVAFSFDGRELAVGRIDGTVKRYALPSLRPIGRTIGGQSTPIGQISYQPGGSLLAAASADAVALIDRSTNTRIAAIPSSGLTPVEASFGSDEFAYGDGTALFGDNGRLLVTKGYATEIPAQFGENGQQVSPPHGTAAPALLVSLVPSDWVAAACAAAGRNLTRTEWTQLVGSSIPYDRTCREWPVGT